MSASSTTTLMESDMRYALDGPAASPISPGFTPGQTSGNNGRMI
jgi:hypothetical protein